MYRLFIAIIICFSIAGGFLVETSNAQRPSPLPVNCAKAAAATSIDNVTPVRQADGDFHFILDGWFPRVEECGFRSGSPGTATTAFAYAYRANEYNDRFEFKLPLNGTVRKGTDYRTGYYDGYFLGGPTQIILGPNTENSKNYIKQPLRQYRIQLHYCVDVIHNREYGECRNFPKQIKSGWVTVREPSPTRRPTSTPRPPTSTPRPPTSTPRPPTSTPRPPTSLPDIVLESVSFSQSRGLEIVISNQGETAARSFLELTITNLDNGQSFDSPYDYYVGDPGDERSSRVPASLFCGKAGIDCSQPFRVRAMIDSRNAVSESDESNNTKEYTYAGDIDLTIGNPGAPGGIQNTAEGFSVRVCNQGQVTSSQKFKLEVTNMDNTSGKYQTSGSWSVPAPGECTNPITFDSHPCSAIGINCDSAYAIAVTADSQNSVPETNENNNTRNYTYAPSPTSSEPCPLKPEGDADCDQDIDRDDLSIFKAEVSGESSDTAADFNEDEAHNLTDFFIWRTGFLK